MSESHPPRRRRRRRHRVRTIRIAVVLLMLAVIVAAVYGVGRALFREPEQKEQPSFAGQSVQETEESLSPQSHYARKESFYTILVSGVDNNNGGSDTNILVAVDAGKGESIY